MKETNVDIEIEYIKKHLARLEKLIKGVGEAMLKYVNDHEKEHEKEKQQVCAVLAPIIEVLRIDAELDKHKNEPLH